MKSASTNPNTLQRRFSFLWYLFRAVLDLSQLTTFISFTPTAPATSFCLNPFSPLAFLIHLPKVLAG